MQRNPHRYQIATSYRTSYSLRLVNQTIKRNLSFLFKKSLVKVVVDFESAKNGQKVYGQA